MPGEPRRSVQQELVAAKLAPPAVRAGSVSRPRLLAALTASQAARLTLVEAPTGYGKTMLLADWADRRAAVAWVSLAPTENDPALLTRYLIQALRGAGAAIGDRAERLLLVPGASPAVWMRALVNDLSGSGRITLVLDDYHAITEPGCHAVVRFLLEFAPAPINLVVCTRAAPPLGLGALRVAGGLAELGAAELRFTGEEATELLLEREQLALEPDAVAALAARTEGWPAGLYLAALWLRGGAAPDALEHFAGDNRHVADYLREAVLERLPAEVREVLLCTSITDRLSGALCDAIMDRPAAAVLEVIERENLFLVPLDQQPTWFRYHHLFREMLRGELARTRPDEITTLHRRACAWYRDTGLVSEAIEHATAAGDTDQAAALIGEHWLAAGRAGQAATVMRWLNALDPRDLPRHPELGVVGGVVVGVSGGSETTFRPWRELAERGLSDPAPHTVSGATSLLAGVGLLRSAFGHRDIGAAIADAAKTARLESDVAGEFRTIALANLGVLLYLSGEAGRARRILRQVTLDPQAPSRPYASVIALATAALLTLDDGIADTGAREAQHAVEFAATVGLADNPVAGLAYVALGRSLELTHQPKAAGEHLERATILLRGSVLPAWHVYALLAAAPLRQQLGNSAGAYALVDEAETLLVTFADAGTLSARLGDVKHQMELRRRRRPQVDSAGLTEAELSVLRKLRGARSQREIAADLSVSVNTVKTHCRAIHRKLGVTSREQAVARATERALL